jgi:iron complex transport system substrate-binding protein
MRQTLWVIVLVGSLFIQGCTKPVRQKKEGATIVVTDFRGVEVSLNAPAQRVVCLIESALTGIYMLQAEDVLVGVPSEVYYGSVAHRYAKLDERIAERTLPAPGNWDFISLEQIVALKPDLVIIWASQTEAIENIERFGIPVYAVMLNSFEDVFKEIADFGMLLNRKEQADRLVVFTNQSLQKIKQNNQHEMPVRGYFMWAQGINHTSGRGSTVNDLFEHAGVLNVVHSNQEHLTVNVEKIIEWDPDIIVMWYNEAQSPSDIIRHPLLQGISAIRTNRIYMLPTVFDCDLWTLKMQHAVKLVANWAYGDSSEPFDTEIELSALLNVLYNLD